MELAQKINFKTFSVDMSPSLLNVMNEVANYYLKSKFIASVKHIILG